MTHPTDTMSTEELADKLEQAETENLYGADTFPLNDLLDKAATRLRELREELEEARSSDAESVAMYHRARGERDALRTELEAEREKVERLRKTLDFYAEVDHYRDNPYRMTVVHEDRGRRAREALEPPKEANDE